MKNWINWATMCSLLIPVQINILASACVCVYFEQSSPAYHSAIYLLPYYTRDDDKD